MCSYRRNSTMIKYLVILALAIQLFECCEKTTFADVEIKASKYFHLTEDSDDVIKENFTGCITQTDRLKGVVQLTIKDQEVPILYEGAVEGLEWLHSLELDHDMIEEIQAGAFKDLPTLTDVSLKDNVIKEIPAGVFNNLAIKRLILANNEISTIAPMAFDNMPNLQKIDLDHNKLQEWNPAWFTNSPSVRSLSARFNELTELPANAFQNINGKHEGLGSSIYTVIQLDNNKISKINQRAFGDMKYLDYLYLQDNEIQTIPVGTFGKFDKISNLNLNNNKITCLSNSFLHSLPTTELIDVNNNHLDCECLKKMKEWSRKHTANIKLTIRSIECMQERIRNTLDSVKDIN